MASEEVDIEDGQVPFADRRFSRDDMIEAVAPAELAQFLEQQIAQSGVQVGSVDFLEIRCVSSEFATAAFMIKRGAAGELVLLTPSGALRKPN
jgi:hypothetical protein